MDYINLCELTVSKYDKKGKFLETYLYGFALSEEECVDKIKQETKNKAYYESSCGNYNGEWTIIYKYIDENDNLHIYKINKKEYKKIKI